MIDRTGRRSSPCRHPRPRRVDRRTAGGAGARRSAPGDRRAGSPPTGRTRCSRRCVRPVASRAGRPGVVACRMPRHSSSASSPRRPVAVHAALYVTVRAFGSSGLAGRRLTVRSRPLCYRAATHADQPRAPPAPQTGAPAPPQGGWLGAPSSRDRHPHRPARPGRHDDRDRSRLRRGHVQPLCRRPARPQGRPDRPRLRAADDHLRPHRQVRTRPPWRAQARGGHVRRTSRAR